MTRQDITDWLQERDEELLYYPDGDGSLPAPLEAPIPGAFDMGPAGSSIFPAVFALLKQQMEAAMALKEYPEGYWDNVKICWKPGGE